MNLKKRILSVVSAVAMVAAMGSISVFADTIINEQQMDVTTDSNGTTEFAQGVNIERVIGTTNVITFGTAKNTDGKIIATFTIEGNRSVISASKIDSAAASLKTIVVNKTDDTKAKEALDKILEKNKDAKAFPVSFSNNLDDFGFSVNAKIAVDTSVYKDGSTYLYLFNTSNSSYEQVSSLKVADGNAEFVMTKSPDYIISNVSLDLSAGEPTTDAAAAITTAATDAAATEATTAPATNPATGNAAPFALALVAVTAVGAIVISKKNK